MDKVNESLILYDFKSRRLSLINDSDYNVSLKSSEELNKALSNLNQKDINKISVKFEEIKKELAKLLALAGSSSINLTKYSIDQISDLIVLIEEDITNIIIEKNSINIGVFSSNKKDKKMKVAKLDSCVEKISKYQEELVMLKNEYEKIISRKTNMEDIEDEDVASKEDKTPLERTINFYMKKEKEN